MSVSSSVRSSPQRNTPRNTTPPRGNSVVGTNPRGGQCSAIIFAAHQRTPTTSPGTTPKDSSLGILGGGIGGQPFSSLHCGPPGQPQQQQYTNNTTTTAETDMIFGDVPISNNLTTEQRNQQQQHAPHSSRVQPLLNHSPALSTFLEEFHKLKDSLFDLSLSQGNEEEEENDCSIAPSGQEKSIRNLITRLRKLHLEDAQQYLEVLLNLCEKFSTAIACPPTPEKDAFGGEEAPTTHLSASGTKTGTTFSSNSLYSYPPTPAVLPNQLGNHSSAQLVVSGRAASLSTSSFNLFVSPSVGLNLGDAMLPPNKTSELPSNASSASLSTFQPAVLTTKVVNNDGSELSAGGQSTDALSEINQYTLLREVGSGSQGTVYLGFDNKAGEFRAVKEIRRGLPGSAVNLKLKDEVRIMKRLRHENIVTLHEILDDPRANHLYLVMQYVEKGPVVQWIDIGEGKCEMIDPWRLQYFSRQVTAGLMYLHERKIYHQDIKPDNILLGTDDRVFLADFGVAQSLQFDASSFRDLCSTSLTSFTIVSSPALGAGTPAYFAPELLEAIALEKTIEDLDRSAVDIWALGVSFYQLLCGRLPFAVAVKPHEENEPETALQDDGDVAPLPSSYASPLINVARSSSEEFRMNPPLSSSCSTAYFPDDADDDDRGLDEKAVDDDHEGGESSNSISVEEPTDDSTNSEYRLLKLKERFPAGWHCYLSSVLHDSIQMSDDFKSNFFIPPEWKSLLTGMLQKDPSKRWSLTEVRQEIKSMGRQYEDDETRLALGSSTTMKISEDGVSTGTTSKGRRKKLQDEVAQAHLNV